MSPAGCAHLHVHSEYSLLDGACKIDALAARAAAFDQPAIGLTDHGVMNGAVELVKAAKKHGIKPIVGLEAYYVDDRHFKRRQGRAQPPHAARRERRGLPQPGQALQRRLPRGPAPRQARRGHGAAVAAQRRRHLPDGLPGLALQPADHRGPARARRARTSTSSSRSSAPRTSTSRSRRTGSPSRTSSTTRSRSSPREMGRPLVATADVHYLRKEDHFHHSALLCVQTKSTLEQPKMKFDTNEFYLKSTDEMEAAFADFPGSVRELAGDRRALQRRHRARPHADPALPVPGRHGGAGVPAHSWSRPACASATGTRRPPRRSSAWRWSSASSSAWATAATS